VLQVKQSSAVSCSCYGGNADEEETASAGEAAAVLRASAERSGSDPSVVLPMCSLGDNNVTQGVMLSQDEYDRLKYESPLVRKLRELEVSFLSIAWRLAIV
jgi:hypothetical protein